MRDVVAIGGACVAGTFAILVLLSAVRRRQISGSAARLADVELDSGPTTVTTHYRGFRFRSMRRTGVRRVRARVVLTATHLHIIERPQRYGIFRRDALDAFTVGVLDGRLRLHSTSPPGAGGGIDYRIAVADPQRWVAALAAAGAAVEIATTC